MPRNNRLCAQELIQLTTEISGYSFTVASVLLPAIMRGLTCQLFFDSNNRDLDLERTMSNSSEDFSSPTTYSNFKILGHLFFELSCLHTHTQTDTDTRRRVFYTCGLNRKYNK